MDEQFPQQTPEAAPPETAPASALGNEYATPALERIREAVRGNGIKSDDVAIEKLTGEVTQFGTETSLILRVRTMEKIIGGKKAGGEKVDGPNGIREAVDKERKRILDSLEINTRIKTMVLERKDKGFGIRNEVIKLPFLNKEYVHHQPCKTCGAQGNLRCQRCHGKGFETCPRCNGQSMEMCSQCRGAQLVYMGNGQQTCPKCSGQGRTPCTMCNQTRKIPCPTCRTKGSTQCQNCNGHAWHSYITMAEVDVVATFSFVPESVPDKLIGVIEPRAREIPNFAEINVLPPRPPTPEQPQESDEISLEFHVIMPYAEAEFRVGKGDNVHAFLLGKQSEIANIPAFLDPLLKNGMRALQEAAEGRGDVAKKIGTAGKYRTIRQAIIASAKYSKGKAAKLVLKNNSLGLSHVAVKEMITNADQALKNITAKPRRNGAIIGALLAAVLYLVYLAAPIRAMIISAIPNPLLHIAVDGVILGVGMMFAVFTIQIFGAGAIKKALDKLLPPDQKNSILSKPGHSGLYAALLCVAMFLVACEISVHAGAQSPDWYLMVRGLVS